MLKIAICDDDLKICGTLDELLTNESEKIGLSLEIDVFHSGGSMIEALSKGDSFDAIYLDIEMDKINGIEVGKWIREESGDDDTKIIYISWEKNYAMDLFAIRPTNFLLKPLSEEAVKKTLVDLQRLCMDLERWYFFKVNNELNRVAYKDILYFESSNRKVTLVSCDGAYTFYGKLQDIEKNLDDKVFWQIHKSYIVNVDQVAVFQYEGVTLTNGKYLPISQSRRKEIRSRQLL